MFPSCNPPHVAWSELARYNRSVHKGGCKPILAVQLLINIGPRPAAGSMVIVSFALTCHSQYISDMTNPDFEMPIFLELPGRLQSENGARLQ